jgi:pentatricopeptide repeat protein
MLIQVRVYSAAGMADKAVTVYREMTAQGIAPNDTIRDEVLRACGAVGAADQALETLQDMIARGAGKWGSYVIIIIRGGCRKTSLAGGRTWVVLPSWER